MNEPSDPGDYEDNAMVALFLPAEVAAKIYATVPAEQLPSAEKPQDYHVTLAFLPNKPTDDQFAAALAALATIASSATPIPASISGIGVFTEDTEPVTYASVDSPALPQLHAQVVEALESIGIIVAHNHGFSPHATLLYGDSRDIEVPNEKFTFSALSLATGARREHLNLGASADPTDSTGAPAPPPAKVMPPDKQPPDPATTPGPLPAAATATATATATVDHLREQIRALAVSSTPAQRHALLAAAYRAGLLHLAPDAWRNAALAQYLTPAPSPATAAATGHTAPTAHPAPQTLEQKLSTLASTFNAAHAAHSCPSPLTPHRLRAVYLRGVSEHGSKTRTLAASGAQLPVSCSQWALARVSSFLRLCAGDPSARTTDADLLPEHPR